MMILHEAAQSGRLMVAELRKQTTAVTQQLPCVGCDHSKDVQSVRAAVQSQTRIVIAHFRFECGDGAARYVGRVGNDQVERTLPRKGGEAIRRQQPDSIHKVMTLDVLPSKFERRERDIARDHPQVLALSREVDGQAAAAGSNIQRPKGCSVRRLLEGAPASKPRQRVFCKLFGFGAWYQRLPGDLDRKPAKAGVADDVL